MEQAYQEIIQAATKAGAVIDQETLDLIVDVVVRKHPAIPKSLIEAIALVYSALTGNDPGNRLVIMSLVHMGTMRDS